MASMDALFSLSCGLKLLGTTTMPLARLLEGSTIGSTAASRHVFSTPPDEQLEVAHQHPTIGALSCRESACSITSTHSQQHDHSSSSCSWPATRFERALALETRRARRKPFSGHVKNMRPAFFLFCSPQVSLSSGFPCHLHRNSHATKEEFC